MVRTPFPSHICSISPQSTSIEIVPIESVGEVSMSEIDADPINSVKDVEELTLLLKSSEFEKDMHINECEEAKIHVSELESKIREMTDELTKSKSTQSELLRVEKRLVEAMNGKVEAMEQMEVMETRVKDIKLLESELSRLMMELKLRDGSELTRLETMRSELVEIRDRENKAHVELELLKAELRKERSKTAAAEAAEVKGNNEKSSAYFALQQMAIKTQEVKEENKRLISNQEEIQFQDSKSDHVITISLEEYEILVKKSEEAKVDPEENENLTKDIESAMMRVSEFRARAEHATTRAEMAEQAKAALEEQIKERKEQKQRRRAALAALHTASVSISSHSFEDDDNPKTYMPLGNFFKMNL
ncbi:hypothetical protein L1987_07153 [Smallanthus sonchifolius]|uniref:Uncharacterized protein n=1 Tax=Smallanthus sonchifolius TaxID=185202 RepID=A0ACB9K0D7_9ASTR|nr:hypothetical protein L1987_07153 [Smallanthus sonchifolius]